MTPDERKMLSDLADKVAQTPPPPRDPEAEEFIRTRIGNRPDALYVMTQTVLIQNLAIQQAQRQIQELQQRTSGSSGSGSFLGQSGSAGAPGYSQYSGQGSSYSAPAPPPPQQQYASYPSPSPGSGAPGFLRGAAQTAAGVAAGALAFEGIRSMFSHPGYGMGGLGSGLMGGAPVEETVVNNYYGNPGDDNPANFGNSDLSLGDRRDSFADAGTDDASYEDTAVSDVDNVSDDGGFDNSGDDFV
jgi:uncharacterized protein